MKRRWHLQVVDLLLLRRRQDLIGLHQLFVSGAHLSIVSTEHGDCQLCLLRVVFKPFDPVLGCPQVLRRSSLCLQSFNQRLASAQAKPANQAGGLLQKMTRKRRKVCESLPAHPVLICVQEVHLLLQLVDFKLQEPQKEVPYADK